MSAVKVGWLQGRREVQALRCRILDNEHRQDTIEFIGRAVGKKRSAHWNNVDLSSNPLDETVTAISVRYRTAPALGNEAGAEPAQGMARALGASRWVLAQELQRKVEGVREYYFRVDWTGDPRAPFAYNMIAPHLVYDEIIADDPANPVGFTVETPFVRDGKPGCVVEKFNAPARFYSRTEKIGNAETPLEVKSGDAYPWIYDGKPYLPIVLFHAKPQADRVYDWRYGIGLVDCTMNVCLLNSYIMHGTRNAAMMPKYIVDLVAKAATVTSLGSSYIENDPNVITQLMSTKDRAGTVGQWSAAMNPTVIMDVLDRYKMNGVSGYGITQAENKRMAQERSGYAISLSRTQIRERQAATGSAYYSADIETIRIAARLYNTFATPEMRADFGDSFPVDGWTISYANIPLSVEEEKSRREQLKEDLDNKVISRIDYYMRLNSVPREVAEQELARIDKDNADKTSVPPPLNGEQIGKGLEILLAIGSGAMDLGLATRYLARALGMTLKDATDLVGTPVVKPPPVPEKPGFPEKTTPNPKDGNSEEVST